MNTVVVVDLEWCLECGDSRPQEGKQFCSDACYERHHAINQSPIHPSRPSSPALSDLSDNLIFPLDPSEDQPRDSNTRAEDWVGKGIEGVAAWASTIPLGAPPLSSSFKSSSPKKSAPQPIRPRASTSSAASSSSGHPRRPRTKSHPHPASSATLRPQLTLSGNIRKPAPPRLFLHSTSPSCHDCPQSPNHESSSVCSPCTATCTVLPHASTSTYDESPALSPVQPILNPRLSLPSLTTQSATASLSSLATPHTASRPPSRPQSRPSSRPNSLHPSQHRSSLHMNSCPGSAAVSIAGDLDDDEDDDEKTPESRPTKRSWMHAAVKTLSSRVSEWAGSARHQPYAYGHIVPTQGAHAHSFSRQCSLSRVRREAPEESTGSAGPSREPSRPPSPQPSAPIPRVGVPSQGGFRPRSTRAESPLPLFPMQDALARPAEGFFLQESSKSKVVAEPKRGKKEQLRTVRVGRGLASAARTQSRGDLTSLVQPVARRMTHSYIHEDELRAVDEREEREKEREAYFARGRRAERQERSFLQGLQGVVQ